MLGGMYILDISYESPANVEPHVASHGAWVKEHITNGNFLFAGPKKNGLGGVILVRSLPRAELDAVVAADSYAKAKVDYRISEFDCKVAAPTLAELTRA
jgi:uncharacterized protein YciI